MPNKFPVRNCSYCCGASTHVTSKGIWTCRKQFERRQKLIRCFIQDNEPHPKYIMINNDISIYAIIKQNYLQIIKEENAFHKFLALLKKITLAESQKKQNRKINSYFSQCLQNIKEFDKKQFKLCYIFTIKMLQAKCETQIFKNKHQYQKEKVQYCQKLYNELKIQLMFVEYSICQTRDILQYILQLTLKERSQYFRQFLYKLNEKCQFPQVIINKIRKQFGEIQKQKVFLQQQKFKAFEMKQNAIKEQINYPIKPIFKISQRTIYRSRFGNFLKNNKIQQIYQYCEVDSDIHQQKFAQKQIQIHENPEEKIDLDILAQETPKVSKIKKKICIPQFDQKGNFILN